MIYKLVAIYDSKAKAYQLLNQYRTNAEAVRAFSTLCNDSSSQYFKYAEDFSLFEMGTYDDNTGTITQHVPSLIITAISCSNEHNQFYAASNMSKDVA